MKRPPVVHGEYSDNGYEVWLGGRVVYLSANHTHDSSQPAMCEQDRLPLRTVRKFCTRTTREIAVERGGIFGGVERVAEEAPATSRKPSRQRKEKH